MSDASELIKASQEAQWKKIDALTDEMARTKARLSVAENQICHLAAASQQNREEIKRDAEKIIETLSSVSTKLDQYEGGLRIGRYLVRVGIGLSGALLLFKSGDWIGGLKAIFLGIAGQ